MPNNILKDFFYGNINPNEKQFDRNSEYGKAAAGLADEEENSDPCWIRRRPQSSIG